MVSLASLRQAARPSSETPRPNLKVVDQKSVRSRAIRRSLLGLLCALIVVGLFAVALTQARMVQGQHELDGLRSDLQEIEAERAHLQRKVDAASSPSSIVVRAKELGMVRAADPVYIPAVRSAAS